MKKITVLAFVLIIIISLTAACKPVNNNESDHTVPDPPEIQQPTCTEETVDEEISNVTTNPIPNYKLLSYQIKNGRGEEQTQNVIFDEFATDFDDIQTSDMIVEQLEFGDVEGYDEAFFEDRALLKISFSSSYAAYSYYISHIYTHEDSITFGISRIVQAPETLMSDMGGGKVFFVSTKRAEIEGINEFVAVDTTNHKKFFAVVDKGPRNAFSIDLNSNEYAMNFYSHTDDGDYNEIFLNGDYSLKGEVLTFFDDKIVFTAVPSGFVYNAEKSVSKEKTTLVDGMLFEEEEYH